MPIETGLVADWRLDGLTDSSGEGNTLRQWGNRTVSLPHVNPCTFVSGCRGVGYASFVGNSGTVWQGLAIDQSIVGTNNPASIKTEDFSCFAWVKIPIASVYGVIVHNGNISAPNSETLSGWQMGYGLTGDFSVDSTGQFCCTFLGRTIKFTTVPINTGAWMLVGFTFDEDQIFNVYVNNVNVGSYDFSAAAAMRAPNLTNTNGCTEIGISSLYASVYSAQRPISGSIKWLKIWNRTLDASEVTELWEGIWERLVVNLSKNNTYKDVVDIVEMKTGIFDKKTYIIKEIHNCLNELFSKKRDKHFYQWRKLFAITGSANPYTVDLSDTNPLPKQILMVKYFYGDSCENSQVANLASPQELENISQLTNINSTSVYYNDRGDNLELYFGSSFTDITEKAIELHCVRQPNIEAVTLLNYSTSYVDALDSDVKELSEMVSERIM